jgi:hypothetical protein
MARLLNLLFFLALLVWAVMQGRLMIRTKNYRLLVFTAAMSILGVVAYLAHASGSVVMVLIALGTVAYIVVEVRQQ